MSDTHNEKELYSKYIRFGMRDLFVDVRKTDNNTSVLKLTERKGKDRDTRDRSSIIIPSTVYDEFLEVVQEALKAARPSNGRRGGRSNSNSSNSKPVPSSTAAPSSSVFVTNLSFDTTESELKSHFSAAGKVINATVHTRTNRDGKTVSSGRAIVEYGRATDATRAIQQLNGSTLDGREIRCVPARSSDNEDDSPRGGRDRDTKPAREERRPERKPAAAPESKKPVRVLSRDHDREPKRRDGEADPSKVFVNNLSWETTEEDLKDLFERIGRVRKATIKTTSRGRSLGKGIVEFAEDCAAEAVERLNDQELDGRQISVREFFTSRD